MRSIEKSKVQNLSIIKVGLYAWLRLMKGTKKILCVVTGEIDELNKEFFMSSDSTCFALCEALYSLDSGRNPSNRD